MEKLLKSSDKEFMRMAILKHEEIFRQQVYELHRLYRIQKVLTNNTVDHQKQDQRSYVAGQIRATSLVNDNQRLQTQRNTKDQVDPRALDHESDIELTLSLGPTTYSPIRPKPDKSESDLSTVSSSSTGSSQTRKISPKNTRSSTRDFTWGAGKSSSNNNNNSFSREGSESVDPGFSNGQENNPPWMFQALSLNLS